MNGYIIFNTIYSDTKGLVLFIKELKMIKTFKSTPGLDCCSIVFLGRKRVKQKA